MTDISNLSHIKHLVDSFYSKVREDSLIGPIFNERIGDNWPVHLNKMYTFWQTVLLQEHTYTGSPFPPHAKLPVEAKHFERWMQLFTETMKAEFEGPKAEEALMRAGKMAEMFQIKINYFRDNS